MSTNNRAEMEETEEQTAAKQKEIEGTIYAYTIDRNVAVIPWWNPVEMLLEG
jgi:hypothetical protein